MKDLSHLPRAEQREGLTPDREIRFGHLLAEKFAQRPDKPTALGTRMRFSDSGKCARYLSLKVAGFIPEPMDIVGHHSTGLGEMIHDAWQECLVAAFPDAQIEAKGSIEECESSGSCDGLIVVDGKRIILELKTIGGFAMKLAVGERGQAQGPKTDHIIQTALNARAHDADEAVIVYLSREAISKGAADRKGIDELGRFVAEWTFTRDQLELYAEREIARQAEVLRLVDDGRLAPRHVPYEMPAGARIVDTDKARWELRDGDEIVDTGQVWGGQLCLYCDQKPNCDLFADPGTPEFEPIPTEQEDVA